MLASLPADMVNQKLADLGIPNRFSLTSSRSRVCWDSSGVYHSCRQMDHGGEALIGLVGAHCDAFELLEPAEKVLDEMAPFVHLLVDGERPCAARMLGDDGLPCRLHGLPRFVTVHGGAYFFLPGLAALRYIASD